MTVTKKLQLKIKLSDGKAAVINLPEAINDTLTDPTTHQTIWQDTFNPIKAVYESDSGATIATMGYHVIETVDTDVVPDAFDGDIA